MEKEGFHIPTPLTTAPLHPPVYLSGDLDPQKEARGFMEGKGREGVN